MAASPQECSANSTLDAFSASNGSGRQQKSLSPLRNSPWRTCAGTMYSCRSSTPDRHAMTWNALTSMKTPRRFCYVPDVIWVADSHDVAATEHCATSSHETDDVSERGTAAASATFANAVQRDNSDSASFPHGGWRIASHDGGMTSARSVSATSAASADYTHSLPAKRIGAGVLFFNQAGHVLLVQTAYKAGWEIPGGCVERDEAPRQAAMREVAEELGLAVVPGRLLAVDWVPPRDGRTDGVMMVFDGGVLSDEGTAAIALPPEELLDWAWCTPDQEVQRLIPLLARRVAACRVARRDGLMVYLENGSPVG